MVSFDLSVKHVSRFAVFEAVYSTPQSFTIITNKSKTIITMLIFCACNLIVVLAGNNVFLPTRVQVAMFAISDKSVNANGISWNIGCFNQFNSSKSFSDNLTSVSCSWGVFLGLQFTSEVLNRIGVVQLLPKVKFQNLFHMLPDIMIYLEFCLALDHFFICNHRDFSWVI